MNLTKQLNNSNCPAYAKGKCTTDDSLLHLFVGYIVAQDSDTHSKEEIRHCVEILKSKTIREIIPFQSVVRKKLNRLLPILLACNDDVNFIGICGQTILHIFILHYTDTTITPRNYAPKDGEIVATLLRKGASVDVVDSSKNTPVHYAAINRRTDLVLLMLDGFTNVNLLNREMNTVLSILVINYDEKPNDLDLEAISVLVFKGADFKKPMKNLEMSLFEFAMKRCLIKILAIFKTKSDESDQDLLLQIYNCVTEWPDRPEELQHLDRLLNLKVILDFRHEEYLLTPLHCASKFDQKVVVEILLNAGADIDAVTIDGLTPLHLAVINGNFEMSKFLIERGANLHLRDKIFDFGLMQMATFKCNKDIINLLSEHGLNLEDQSRDGFTPLHLAAMKGDDWMIKYLISHGVDVNCRTGEWNFTPLHLAIMQRNCVSLLEKYESQISMIYPIFESLNKSKLKQIDSLIMLLQAGAHVNSRDRQFKTPLHYAVTNGDGIKNDGMLTLLDYGAHVDVQDIDGSTPLSIASSLAFIIAEPCGNLCSSLIRYGAEIDYLNIVDLETTLNADRNYGECYGLLQYVKLLREIELPIKEDHEQSIVESLRFRRYHRKPAEIEEDRKKLDEEIAKLKTHYLTDGETLLYKFLHANSRDRYFFAQSVLSLDLKNEYPIYHIVIENSCRRAINKNLFLRLAASALKRLVHSNLPDMCTEMIFGFMSMSEMIFFIHSMESVALKNLKQ